MRAPCRSFSLSTTTGTSPESWRKCCATKAMRSRSRKTARRLYVSSTSKCLKCPTRFYSTWRCRSWTGHRRHISYSFTDVGRERIPIVLLTGVANLSQIAALVGTPYFLEKPFALNKLLALVAKALSERIPPHPGNLVRAPESTIQSTIHRMLN